MVLLPLQAKKCTAQGVCSYVYRIEKTNSHKWKFVKVLHCSLLFPKYTLFLTPSVFTSSYEIVVHKIKKLSFSSSYNKTHKTYWGEMLLLSSLFINSLLHKLQKQAYHQRIKNSYSYVQHFYTFDLIFMKNCKYHSCQQYTIIKLNENNLFTSNRL